jgi:hypothetical protein
VSAILTTMRARWLSPLLAALIAVAVLVLHELRYLIGYGADAGTALATQGHSYLPSVSLAAVVLLALAVGRLLLSFRAALRTATAGSAPPFGVLWLAAICALLAVYCSQELLEGLLATGHPVGFAALAVDGGWSAIPLAVALGGVVALLLRGAAAAEALVAAYGRRASAGVARPAHARRRPDACTAPRTPLAANLAGRAPPAVAS